ncbi:MAPEG family protein [Pseudomonas panipatensis]|uniref:MAPEG family protein n=1 Tax=Pseudomonas panipatensis TaxID=428992 RepID=UPI0035AF9B7A
MPIAFWCVLIALFLPYLGTAIAKFSGGGFGPRQNHDPRTFLAGLEGYRKRAHYFQLNSFEVTPAFAIAVLVAYVVGNAEPATIDRLAIAWIASRALYLAFYLADQAILRSLAWFVGLGLIIGFFVISA